MLRLCTYNIAWFNELFNKDNSLKSGNTARQRLDAIRHVLETIQPDFIGIVEAPNTIISTAENTREKLRHFVNSTNLPLTGIITGFISAGRQEIAALFNPQKLTVFHTPGGERGSQTNPRFDGEFYHDTDKDRIKEVYKFYRPPLELTVKVKNTSHEFHLMVVHTKSKGIFSSMDMVHWQRETRRNRLKLYAECEWIRRRVDEWLNENKHVIVMGDINDGPGMDYYEMKFGRSAVEIIMGDIFVPERLLKSHIGRPTWTSYGWSPSSTNFRDPVTHDRVNVLIDHILVSQQVSVLTPQPHRVWNPYDLDDAMPMKELLFKASDHFPVTLDLALTN